MSGHSVDCSKVVDLINPANRSRASTHSPNTQLDKIVSFDRFRRDCDSREHIGGYLEHFDFFVLSDSNQPNQWIQEEVAWLELCKQVGGFGKIFYRKRRISIC